MKQNKMGKSIKRIKEVKNIDKKKEKTIKTITVSAISIFILAIVLSMTILFQNIISANKLSASDMYDTEYIQNYANILKKFSETEFTDEDYQKIALFKIVYENYAICDIGDDECLKEQANYHKDDIENLVEVYLEEHNGQYYEAAKEILSDDAERKYTEQTSDTAINFHFVIEVINTFVIVSLVILSTIYFIFIKNSKPTSKRIREYVIISFMIYILDILLANANNLFFNHFINHVCKYCSFSIGTDSFIVWKNGAFAKGFLNPLVLLLVVILSIIIHVITNKKKN